MNAITMTETNAQRDAERVRDHSERMLTAQQRIHSTSSDAFAVELAAQAIEYASGEKAPDAEPGYGVDAAGTFVG